MSREFLDESSRISHGTDSSEVVDDDASMPGGSRHDTRGTAQPRLRDDPAGRRSLTGVEFRRQRSRR
jgi:hypothetical protein